MSAEERETEAACWVDRYERLECAQREERQSLCRRRPRREEGTMAQKEIEVILTRQLASYLAMPIIIIDSAGTLLFYNEPAEVILGRRFEETGELSADEWAQLLVVTDAQGTPLALETRPLLLALTEQRPTHCKMWLEGLD